MATKNRRFSKLSNALRALGAGNAAWHFLTSQAAAVYMWGPLVTAWVVVAGLLGAIPVAYLIPSALLAFGGLIWCFWQADLALERFAARYQKIKASYDRSVPSCRADVTFDDQSHSICFRLKVENATRRRLHKCEGWLESTDRFPNISAAQLFWVGNPKEEMSISLIKQIPRFLQICRIDSGNRIHMGTERELWPIDSLAFPPGDYVFKVGIKGEDNAETCFCSVRLIWTGNWSTAEMVPVSVD